MDKPLLVSLLLTGLAVSALVEAVYFLIRSSADRSRRSVSRRLQSVRSDVSNPASAARLRLLKDESLSASVSLDRFLRGIPSIVEFQGLLESAGVGMRAGTFLAFLLGAGGTLILLGVLAGWNPGLVILAGIAPLLASVLWLRVKRRARQEKFLEQMPEALDLIARSVRAGYAFAAGLQMVAEELPDPIAAEFRIAFEERNLGASLRDVMEKLAERMDIMEARLFATGVLIQAESGGNLAEVLDNLAYMVRERFRVKGKIRALSAEGRLSAVFLITIPILVLAFLWLWHPAYLRPLWEWRYGPMLIAVTIAWMAVGVIWIRSIVNIRF